MKSEESSLPDVRCIVWLDGWSRHPCLNIDNFPFTSVDADNISKTLAVSICLCPDRDLAVEIALKGSNRP